MVKIAQITASFANSKNNLSFNVQEQTGHIKLITDATQLAEASKLLLLAGKGKTFTVVFHEGELADNSDEVLDELEGAFSD